MNRIIKKALYIAPVIMSISLFLEAQEVAKNTYWFYFTDKENNEYSFQDPEQFLSKRSLNRRAWQSLPLEITDLPVTSSYVDSLESLGLTVVHTSKWLNGALVESIDQPLIDTLHRITFIDTLPWKPEPSAEYILTVPSGSRFAPPDAPAETFNYGYAFRQTDQLKAQYLHQNGYTGRGVYVAVLDGGFVGMDNSLPAFMDLMQDGRLIATRNLVRDLSSVYDGISHGTRVASVIAGNWDGFIVGTGPGVSLILAATENPMSETRIEEFAWIEAAEWADSLGADVINTSLGYSTFDDTLTNYTYADMDGRTAFISRANSLLASKGIVSVTSAGNSGDDSWFYITAPADASDILSVGAIDSTETITAFSSRGPTFDQRIKPDVVALGRLVVLQSQDGSAQLSNGTSFSSPLIAGAVASLWQAYPEMPASELIRAVRASGDRRYNPDATYGYGVPDFLSAFHAISSVIPTPPSDELRVYPNPFRESIRIDLPPDRSGMYTISVYDLQGRKVYRNFIEVPCEVVLPGDLRQGMYLLELNDGMTQFRARILK